MIALPKTAKDIKELFLDKNGKYIEVKDTTPSIGEFYSINEDDEVWIMQCPKGLDISLLKDQKIKFPGRSNQDELEIIAAEYPQPMLHSFGHKNRKGHNGIKMLNIQGNIMLRTRLKTVLPPEETLSETQPVRVPLPAGIKERHPLHGDDYESKLELRPDIAERLKRADEVSIRSKSKRKSKSKNQSKKPKTITIDSDSDVELVTKRSKKKKRKHVTDEEVADSSKEKNKKKNSFNEDIAEDLQWIQKL